MIGPGTWGNVAIQPNAAGVPFSLMNATRLSYKLRRAEGGHLKERRAIAGLSLVTKAGFDAFKKIRLLLNQGVEQKADCIWDLLTAAASIALLPFALLEARAVIREK